MARTATLPPQVKKLIKEIAGVEKRLVASDRANWKGVARTDFPEPMMYKVVEKMAKIEAMRKSGIITGPQYKMAMDQIVEIVPSIQNKIASMGVTGGDMLDFGDSAPARSPVRSQDYARFETSGKYPSTVGNNVAGNAASQLDSTVRNSVPGLIGTEVEMPEPDPRFPPKATRSVGAAPDVRPSSSPQTVRSYRDKLMNPRPRAARTGSTVNSTPGTVFNADGSRVKGRRGTGPSIKLPSVPRRGMPARPPFVEDPRTSVYGINPVAERATMNAPRDMIPDGRPMPAGAINTDATREYDPRVKKYVRAGYGGSALTRLPSGEPTNFAASEGRVGRTSAEIKAENKALKDYYGKGWDKLKGLEKDKVLKAIGKVGKGAVLGLPLLALDYLAPNNAIAASRNEGYGMLEDIGLDVQGGIDSIDNPWLSGGASLLDGLLVDPVMTAVGGAKKFKEMIQDDIAESRRLKKKRKESNWKPKAYRGGMLANGD